MHRPVPLLDLLSEEFSPITAVLQFYAGVFRTAVREHPILKAATHPPGPQIQTELIQIKSRRLRHPADRQT